MAATPRISAVRPGRSEGRLSAHFGRRERPKPDLCGH